MWHDDFINRAINSPTPINDAAAYGVVIEPADVQPGEVYQRIIGVYHLDRWQNVGKRNLFLEVLDESAHRVGGAKVAWGWEGQTPDQIERTHPVILDKPANEPAGNISLDGGQVVWAQVAGIASDRVKNVHTGHPDEPPGNTWGHHSFYVVWQLTIAGGAAEKPPIDPPELPVTAHEVVIRIGNQTIHTGDTTVVLALGSVQRVKVANQEIETGRDDIVITIEVVAL